MHPHVKQEQAEKFRAWNGGSTEVEYRNLLVAVADCLKPRRALETGILHPWALPGLAAVCDRLEVVDVDGGACAAANGLGLPNLGVHQGDALEWIRKDEGVPFDFVFLDTHLPKRAMELEALLKNRKLTDRAVVAIHDTSRLRTMGGAPCLESLSFWEAFHRVREKWSLEVIEMLLSRGMLLVQRRGK